MELLSRVAQASGLEGAAAEKYVRAGLEDLRSRLRGWPPAPSAARISAGPAGSPPAAGGPAAFQGEVVSRRVYDTPSGERVLVLTEELRRHTGRRLGDCAEKDALLDPELWPEGAPPGGGAARQGSGGAAAPSEPADGVEGYRFLFYADSREPLKLHWGWVGAVEGGERVAGHAQWLVPPEACRPAHTRCTEEACRTELRGGGGLQVAALEVMRADAPVAGISFVLQEVTSGNWLKAADGGDFFAPLPTEWLSAESGDGPDGASAGAEGEGGAQADAPLSDASPSLAAALYSAQGETEVYRNAYAVKGLGRLLVTVSTSDRPGFGARDAPLDSMSSMSSMSMDADWDDIGRGSSSGYVVSLLCELEEDMPLALNWGLAMEAGGSADAAPAGAVDGGLSHEEEVLNVSGQMLEPAWVSPGGVEGVELPGGTECSEESCETEIPALGDGSPIGGDPSGAGGRFVKRVKVNIQPEPGLRGVSFVLKSGSLEFHPEGCRDFFVPVPSGVLQSLLKQARESDRVASAQVQQLGRGGEAGSLLCIVGSAGGGAGAGGGAALVRPVEIFSDCLNHLVLHWGLQQSDGGAEGEDGAASEAPPGGGWIIPEPEEVPAGSRFEQGACETPFRRAPAVVLGGASASSEWRGPLKHEPKEGLARLQCVSLEIPARYDAVAFVVRTASWGEFGHMDHVGDCVDSGEEVWFRDHWRDFLIPVAPDSDLEDGSSSDG